MPLVREAKGEINNRAAGAVFVPLSIVVSAGHIDIIDGEGHVRHLLPNLKEGAGQVEEAIIPTAVDVTLEDAEAHFGVIGERLCAEVKGSRFSVERDVVGDLLLDDTESGERVAVVGVGCGIHSAGGWLLMCAGIHFVRRSYLSTPSSIIDSTSSESSMTFQEVATTSAVKFTSQLAAVNASSCP